MKIERSIEQHFKCDGIGNIGVLVKTDLMKKIVKLQSKYLQEYKELLMNNIDSMDTYSWGLAYDDSGKQLSHHYIEDVENSKNDKIQRIKWMTTTARPQKIDYVALVEGRNKYEDDSYLKLKDATADFFLKSINGECEDE